MAIDNSLYESLETTYIKINDYLSTNQLGREHSEMIIKNEELCALLETLDIEALEERSTDIHGLHAELNSIKEISQQALDALQNLSDSHAMSTEISTQLTNIFEKVNNLY